VARGRPAEPWESVEEWAGFLMEDRGYTRWEMAQSGTGVWFYPGIRHTRYAPTRKADFFQLPASLKEVTPDG
jgi:hypothetical protein